MRGSTFPISWGKGLENDGSKIINWSDVIQSLTNVKLFEKKKFFVSTYLFSVSY